ncbi:MAG: cyclic nucleotide-binding domain-containing protein [Deltaproteobacteria bacterium]|nr:cyclic nucleotide-binding domain-containing protein [Deltaproteobacteria bacterium]
MTTPGDYAFLRRTALLRTLPDDVLQWIYERGEVMYLGAGRIIFSEGNSGFDIFVVKSGIVEVIKNHPERGPHVVSYQSAGDCFGEMSFITGLLRSATVKVPTRAEVFRIPAEAFDQLLHEYPEVSLALAKVLAYRLQVANELHAAEKFRPTHLSGDLAFFDVPDVLQTLTQGRRTGVMRLKTSSSELGDVLLYFDEGSIRHAQAGPFKGKEALLWLFSRRLMGSFEFETSERYLGPENEEGLDDSPMGLLLEAARRKDELDEIKAKMPPADHVFKRVAAALPWAEPVPRAKSEDDSDESTGTAISPWQPETDDDLQLLRQVWYGLGQGMSYGQLVASFANHEYAVQRILYTLSKLRNAIA